MRGAEAGVLPQLAAKFALDGAGEGDGVAERGAGEHEVQLVAGVAEQPIAHDATDEVKRVRAGAGDDFEEEGGALRAELLVQARAGETGGGHAVRIARAGTSQP